MKIVKELIPLPGMIVLAHLQEYRPQVFTKSQYTFEKSSGKLVHVIEPAVMTDDLRYFGTEFKIPAGCFGRPFADHILSVHLVMRGVELDTVVMLYILFQEINVFGAFRVDLTQPFPAPPYRAAEIYFGMLYRIFQ